MVFSQTSQKTQSTLKVVDLSLLRPAKQEKNSIIGGVTDVDTLNNAGPSSSAQQSTSRTEDILQLESEVLANTMFQNTDCEFFQDLDPWCSIPAEEERAQTIDMFKITEDNTKHDTHTTHPLSSDFAAAELLSPTDALFYQDIQLQDKYLDIQNLPVVFRDAQLSDPQLMGGYTPNTFTNNDQAALMQMEDSLEPAVAVSPEALQWEVEPSRKALRLDVARPWTPPLEVNTPDVLNFVEELEESTETDLIKQAVEWPHCIDTFEPVTNIKSSPLDFGTYAPITPKTESHVSSDEEGKCNSAKKRPRRDSNDSDETYTPYAEKMTPRKYKRRKANVPIKEMIQELEKSQPVTKAKRGRPPKRRDSNVSSVCSADHSSHSSVPELKYREIRDKNNEASKRSRMNRKLKELQMEQLALDLEERNKKLQVKADILEEMTKRLKDALMTAILKP